MKSSWVDWSVCSMVVCSSSSLGLGEITGMRGMSRVSKGTDVVSTTSGLGGIFGFEVVCRDPLGTERENSGHVSHWDSLFLRHAHTTGLTENRLELY